MDEKKYTIDGKPVSVKEIINKAKEIDAEFAATHFYQTSVAADILRKNGYEVGDLTPLTKKNL